MLKCLIKLQKIFEQVCHILQGVALLFSRRLFGDQQWNVN